MFFGDPRIIQWAESLGTMTYQFRLGYIGLDRQEAISRIRDSWNGAQVAEVDEEVFMVKNERILPLFVFYFKTPKDADGKVEMVLVEADSPFANIVLAVDQRSTNYLLRNPNQKLNKQEKQLCKALEKYAKIPQGRTA